MHVLDYPTCKQLLKHIKLYNTKLINAMQTYKQYKSVNNT